MCAAFPLAVCGPPDPRIAQVLRDTLARESVDLPRASMIVALSRMDDLMDGILFQELQSSSKGLLTKWASAAVQVARWERQAAPQAVDELIGSLAAGSLVRDLYRQFPWGTGNLVADTASLLQGVGPGAAPVVVPRLLKTFRVSSELLSILLAEIILSLSFPGKPGPLAPLATFQIDVLSTFSESTRLGSESKLRELLRRFSLPDTKEGLKALIAG
jgi:hypothetical protein